MLEEAISQREIDRDKAESLMDCPPVKPVYCGECGDEITESSDLVCDVCNRPVHDHCCDSNFRGTFYTIGERCRMMGRSDEFLADRLVERDHRIAELVGQLLKGNVA